MASDRCFKTVGRVFQARRTCVSTLAEVTCTHNPVQVVHSGRQRAPASHPSARTNTVSELRKRDPDLNVLAWYGTVSPAELFLSVLTIGEIRLVIERLRRKRQ